MRDFETMMNKPLLIVLLAVMGVVMPSCLDHDNPKLDPIDAAQVKVTATVKDVPNSKWLNVTEELTINVSDIEMTAPKGVVLRSVSLVANDGSYMRTLDDKPFSGEPMEFKVPLTGVHGRVNFSLRSNLIKKNCRDAEVIIADNIQKIVFSQTPEFQCDAKLKFSVKSKSTTGEEHSSEFDVVSVDHFTIAVPQSELCWTPVSGTASTLEVTIGSSATAWSPNTTFDCKITKMAIGKSSGAEPNIKISIPNKPGALNAQALQLYVVASYFGTWENVTIEPYNLTNVFSIVEE